MVNFPGIFHFLNAVKPKWFSVCVNKQLAPTPAIQTNMKFIYFVDVFFSFVAQFKFLHILWFSLCFVTSPTTKSCNQRKSSSFTIASLAMKNIKSARLTWNVERWAVVGTSNGVLSNCCRKENVSAELGSFLSLITVASWPLSAAPSLHHIKNRFRFSGFHQQWDENCAIKFFLLFIVKINRWEFSFA